MENKYISADRLINLLHERLNDYIQESYWMESFDEDVLYNICMAYADEHDLKIIDHDDFNWSAALYNLYQCTEKGLS